MHMYLRGVAGSAGLPCCCVWFPALIDAGPRKQELGYLSYRSAIPGSGPSCLVGSTESEISTYALAILQKPMWGFHCRSVESRGDRWVLLGIIHTVLGLGKVPQAIL